MCHLKLLLDKTALDVFRVIPYSDKSGVEAVISALKKRFHPGGIEELRGLEFHHWTQGDETIEQFGLCIQQLGRKAFRSIIGKDFDRLLKGRLYQVLLVKWQHKLGPSKAEEGFHDLYTRTRLLEEYEKQYAALRLLSPEILSLRDLRTIRDQTIGIVLRKDEKDNSPVLLLLDL